MKDIIITSRRLKTELAFFIGAFVVANLCNAYAIWKYDASATEMFTSFFYVLTFSFFIYFLTVVIRLIIAGIRLLVGRICSPKTSHK